MCVCEWVWQAFQSQDYLTPLLPLKSLAESQSERERERNSSTESEREASAW